MRILYMLLTLLISASLAVIAASKDQGNDDKDKLTLTINASCEADSAVKDENFDIKDKVIVTLSEQVTYRIVSHERGNLELELELINNTSSINVTGSGTSKDPISERSWSYGLADPKASNARYGSVSINTGLGKGNIDISSFVEGITSDKEDVLQVAGTIAAMTFSFATSTMSAATTDTQSNENFLKGLQFHFNPKSKNIAYSGQANYQFALKGENGPVGTGNLNVIYQVKSGMQEDIVVLIPRSDYKKWLPGAAGKEPNTPGNAITFDIELRTIEGENSKKKTAQFEIELLDTTHYPGSCMNSPWADAEPDLKIIKANNPNLAEISADGQKAKTVKGLKNATITVSSFDGAAVGKISVLAHMDDEDTVMEAHLDGYPELTQVNIPYDSDNNTMADAWEKDNNVWETPLNTDEDDEPQGDRHNGDGLTIWEEYRGFVEDGKHIRTNPKKKDFFMCDTLGGKSKRAINRFAALTKLNVHDKLTLDELSASRIINRNQGEDATHVVDQHGILLDSWHTKGVCIAMGDGPGTPKSTDRVLIDSTLKETKTKKISGGVTKTYEYYEIVVAHELLHCCNVWHHGQVDTDELWWQAETVAGVTDIYEYAAKTDCGHPEKGIKIKAFREVRGRYLPDDPYWATPTFIWRGEKQGQHSGNEDCVMRYDASNAYKLYGDQRYCLIFENQEPVGQGLCVSPTGTGVNDASRSPQARYGNAAAGKGNCADQICVNDLYH